MLYPSNEIIGTSGESYHFPPCCSIIHPPPKLGLTISSKNSVLSCAFRGTSGGTQMQVGERYLTQEINSV